MDEKRLDCVHMTRRSIPSIDRLIQQYSDCGLPRGFLTAVIRKAVNEHRREAGTTEHLNASIRSAISGWKQQRIQPVINATGVVIHTNLGRAPLGQGVGEKLVQTGTQYSNLELDLGNGKRGSRGSYVEEALAILSGAEAATVVNNCAAALVLIIKALTERKKEVVVSRGELVQIGGGFRIPDILESAGATLREVGTTNRTSTKDYEKALGPETGMILKVHQSNFQVSGFVESVSHGELKKLGGRKRCPVVFDLGTGNLFPGLEVEGTATEPTPMQAINAGVDLVCFSGDKLMGGPQAGIIVGKRSLVSRLKKNPFFRALRCDKLILSGLQEVVEAYLGEEDGPVSPVAAMFEISADETKARCSSWKNVLSRSGLKMEVVEAPGTVGGGSLPGSSLKGFALAVRHVGLSAKKSLDFLRGGEVPVIGSIQSDRVLLNPRTVLEHQDPIVLKRLKELGQWEG